MDAGMTNPVVAAGAVDWPWAGPRKTPPAIPRRVATVAAATVERFGMDAPPGKKHLGHEKRGDWDIAPLKFDGWYVRLRLGALVGIDGGGIHGTGVGVEAAAVVGLAEAAAI